MTFTKYAIFCVVEPEKFEEPMNKECWRKSMVKEIDVIQENQTWKLVDKPKNKEII